MRPGDDEASLRLTSPPGVQYQTDNGLPPVLISSSRFMPCRKSSRQSSSMKWTKPVCSMKSQRTSGRKTGTSTPRPYRLKSTASSILPLTSSELPSQTLESSRSKTAPCLFQVPKKGITSYAHYLPRSNGIHTPLSTAYPAKRLHEGTLLRPSTSGMPHFL